MNFLSVIILSLAVSLDGFFAGFAYGVRRVHIPLLSLCIICISSSFSVFLSMKAGGVVASLLTTQIASVLGGLMLITVGAIIIFQSMRVVRAKKRRLVPRKGNKGLSVLSSVLREPARADFDCSGVLTGKEAIVLGVALAIDAFGAGFGAAMMGFTPLITSFAVGITKFVLLTSAIILGRRYSRNMSGECASVVAGTVLILIGASNLL